MSCELEALGHLLRIRGGMTSLGPLFQSVLRNDHGVPGSIKYIAQVTLVAPYIHLLRPTTIVLSKPF